LDTLDGFAFSNRGDLLSGLLSQLGLEERLIGSGELNGQLGAMRGEDIAVLGVVFPATDGLIISLGYLIGP